MSRPIILSNGSLSVGMNARGIVHDFYYPYVGLENHSSERVLCHKIGFWVDGEFSWLNDGSWDIKLDFLPSSLVGSVRAENKKLGIFIETHDFVDSQLDVFARNMHIINKQDKRKEVRVFWHQGFQISSAYTGDTAQYRPEPGVISHYKGRRAFAIYAMNCGSHEGFDQYCVGLSGGEEGHEGTFRDAEDGELSGNAVEHGKVDSTIRVTSILEPLSSVRQHYWIAAANRPHNSIALHNVFRQAGLFSRYQYTVEANRKLLQTSQSAVTKMPLRYQEIFRQSLGIVFNHIDSNGSVIASSDSSILNYGRDYYAYCWPRDAVYVFHPLLLLGYKKPVERFIDFASRTMHRDGYMMHKYQADGSLGSSWHPYVQNGKPELPIQEDETAGVLWLIGEYWKRTSKQTDILEKYYDKLIVPMANFMVKFIDKETGLPHASYDLWEEKFLTSTYSTAQVIAALEIASEMAQSFNKNNDFATWSNTAKKLRAAAQKMFWNKDKQYFYKGFLLAEDGSIQYDDTVDSSSLYGAFKYEMYDKDSDIIKQAVKTAEDRLFNKSGVGGYLRYENDAYWRHDADVSGNPWIITTLWMAHYYLYTGNQLRAQEVIDWVVEKSMSTGVLPEQIHARSGGFAGVAPLNWSHSELLHTLLMYKALAV